MTPHRFMIAAICTMISGYCSLASAQLATTLVYGDDIIVPSYVANAVASSKRPLADKERDANRLPDKVMTFFGVEPGDKVAELLTSSGYYSAVLSGIVGDNGKVYGHNNQWLLDRRPEGSPLLKRIADYGLTNIEEVIAELEETGLPKGEMDAVFMVLIYHDAVGLFETDVAKMNRAVYDSLKPGGVYGIIDHHAAPGAGRSATVTNHRIERHVVVDQITSVGFELAAESDLLENLDDPLNSSVFAPGIRGNTHRMLLKFKKPD